MSKGIGSLVLMAGMFGILGSPAWAGEGDSKKKSSSILKVSWSDIKEYQGKVGEKNWAALFRSYSRGWTGKEDDRYAAEQRNRYDLILFGKKFENVAGHETKVSKLDAKKPRTTFNVELLSNGVKLSGSYSQSFPLIQVTGQFWISAVPVLLKADSAVSFGGKGSTVLGEIFTVSLSAKAGVGVQLTAAIGFSFGYIGIEGAMNIIEGGIFLDAEHDEDAFSIKSGFDTDSSGKVSIVAKIAFAKKKYPVWKSPSWSWYSMTLLDKKYN